MKKFYLEVECREEGCWYDEDRELARILEQAATQVRARGGESVTLTDSDGKVVGLASFVEGAR